MSAVKSDVECVQRLVGPTCGASRPPARVVGSLTGGLLAGWVLAVVARRFGVRTGVSDEGAFGSLPGDEVISHPMVEWTRGVTVHTTPERVWPWLVQMGYGRGGWYTPEWVDLFANRWVFGCTFRRLLSETTRHGCGGGQQRDAPGPIRLRHRRWSSMAHHSPAVWDLDRAG
jgi:hypothetical protein